MSKSVLTLLTGIIIASLIVLTGLGIVAQRLTNQSARIAVPQKSTPIQVPKRAFTDLSAIPTKAEVSVGENFTIAVHITTGENTVTGVQLELSYDPTLITVQSVSAGDFFAKPIIYANKNDSTKGTITFAVGSFDGKKGEGTVAFLLVRPRKASQNTEVVHINPTTIVTELDNMESVLHKSKGASVVIR